MKAIEFGIGLSCQQWLRRRRPRGFLEDAKLSPKSDEAWRAPFLPLLTLGAGAKATVLSVAGNEKKKKEEMVRFFLHMCSFV